MDNECIRWIRAPGDGLDEVRLLLKRLEGSDNPSHLLREVVSDHVFQVDEDKLPDLVKERDQFPLVWHLCNSALEKLCERGQPEDLFYESLWHFFTQSGLFPSGEDKELVLFCVLSNPRVPYVLFDHPLMDDDAFETAADSLAAERRILGQIAMRSFTQKTQEAHAVLDVLDRRASRDEKAVMLAMFLSFVRS